MVRISSGGRRLALFLFAAIFFIATAAPSIMVLVARTTLMHTALPLLKYMPGSSNVDRRRCEN